MIDLSITKNPEWLESRQAIWDSLEEDFKEGLKKRELLELKEYCFTGIFSGQREFSDRAYFKWFPLQTPEGWDYVFENLVNKQKVFEDSFYATLGDLTGSGLTSEQELAMWDYFAGEVFQPVVTSRAPIGKQKKVVSFQVDCETIAAKFSGFLDSWLSGLYGNDPKWKKRIGYFITFMESLSDDFFERDEDGRLAKKGGRCVGYAFSSICKPVYGDGEHVMEDDALNARKDFVGNLFKIFDDMKMPNNMSSLWEEMKISRD